MLVFARVIQRLDLQGIGNDLIWVLFIMNIQIDEFKNSEIVLMEEILQTI